MEAVKIADFSSGEDGEPTVDRSYQTWNLPDFFQFSLGIVDGTLGALPSTSSTYYCNKNSTAARLMLNTVIIDFSMVATTQGMTDLNTLM